MRNIILLALSTLDARNIDAPKIFKYENEEIENCIYQLEPIPRFIYSHMENEKDELVIIALCTSATVNEKKAMGEEEFTALEYFKKRLKETCNLEEKFIVPVGLELDNPHKGICEAIKKIKEEYRVGESRLWIDIHGGLRNVAQIFSAIVSLLRVYEIVPEEILGVEVGKNIIRSQKEAFDIFDYVSGMNDFIHFGDAKVLEQYYAKTRDAQVKHILEAMNDIAEGTQLCDPGKYEDGLKKLRSALQNEIKDDLMNVFADYIRMDYGEVLLPRECAEDQPISALAIVNRCVNKGLYQQALTFMESLMPEVYVKEKILYADASNDADIAAYQMQDRKMYLSKEHFIFDAYVIRLVYYFNKNKNNSIIQEHSGDTDAVHKAAIEKLSQFYELHLQDGQFFTGKPNVFVDARLKDIKVNIAGAEKVITMKSKYSSNFLVCGRLLQIHKALKNCRNLFNHSNPNRPTKKQIENVLKLYIIYAKKLLEYDAL